MRHTPRWCGTYLVRYTHTYIKKIGEAYLASAFFSSSIMFVCVCVAPRGACVMAESVARELLQSAHRYDVCVVCRGVLGRCVQ